MNVQAHKYYKSKEENGRVSNQSLNVAEANEFREDLPDVGVDHAGDLVILKVIGEIEDHHALALDNHLRVIDRAKNGVIIDLYNVTYFCAGGCGWLIRMCVRAQHLGKSFRVRAKRTSIVETVFNILDFHKFMDIDYSDFNKN